MGCGRTALLPLLGISSSPSPSPSLSLSLSALLAVFFTVSLSLSLSVPTHRLRQKKATKFNHLLTLSTQFSRLLLLQLLQLIQLLLLLPLPAPAVACLLLISHFRFSAFMPPPPASRPSSFAVSVLLQLSQTATVIIANTLWDLRYGRVREMGSDGLS